MTRRSRSDDQLVLEWTSKYVGHTPANYEASFGVFRAWCEDHGVDLLKVTPADAEWYKRFELARGRAPSTVGYKLRQAGDHSCEARVDGR